MKKIANQLVFSAMAIGGFAGAQQSMPRPPIVLPPPRLEISAPATEPMELKEMTVHASVRGLYARVETTLVFFNPNKGRQLEGELIFPLPDKAAICGYALDINGALVEGVVVPKEKARVAFETETRRQVDPGLVEHVKGNVYKTRIYPLPASGSRTVRLAYTTPLAIAPNGDAALALPMPREKIGKRTLTIEVADTGRAAPILGGLGNRSFAQAEGFWRVSSTEADLLPGEDVSVALPQLPPVFAAVEKTPDGTVWFTASALAPSLAAEKTECPKVIDILWDASGSRNDASLSLEYALIEALPGEISSFRLYVFRDVPEPVRTFATAKELLAALKTLSYDGGTDFHALRAVLPKDNTFRLLFSDGLDTLSSEAFAFDGLPPTAVVSAPVADREALRQACAGAIVDLQTTTVSDALRQIFSPPCRVTAVEGSGVALIQGLGQTAVGRISVLGRLTVPETTLTIRFGKGASAAMTLRASDARNGMLLATAWAAARVNQLSPRAEDYTEELLALGRSAGVVSPVTSLLVLDSLDQWIRHKIEPPASQPQLREQWLAVMKRQGADETDRRSRHVEQLARLWKSRIDWWERDYSKDPLPSPVAKNRSPSATQPGFLHRQANAVISSLSSVFSGSAVSSTPQDHAVMSTEAAPVPLSSAESQPTDSSAASIQIKAWSPDTPYLAALKAAGADCAAQLAVYAEQRKAWMRSPAFYLDCAGFFFENKEKAIGVRVLSNLAELKIEDAALLRVFAWRLRQAGELDRAVVLLRRIAKLRGEEGQSFRDLALTLMERGKKNRSKADLEEAMQLFIRVAMTPWNRHSKALPLFALEEINALVAWVDAQEWPKGGKPVVPDYDKRFRKAIDTDIRIILSWDADATDIDLHVIEPSLEEAFYGHNRTTKGGNVSQDVTDGYGPEEYMIRRAPHGKYKIRCKYYGSRQQTVVGPATVTATIYTDWGRKNEQGRTMSLRLEKVKDMVDIGEVMFGAASAGARSPADFSRLSVGMNQKDVIALLGEPAGKNGLEWTYLCGKRTVKLFFRGNSTLERALELLPGGISTVLIQ